MLPVQTDERHTVQPVTVEESVIREVKRFRRIGMGSREPSHLAPSSEM
jgi:hypothetical protein